MSISSLITALHASGPALLRTRLRSAGARMHRAVAAADAVQRAGAQLPEAVFGGDLLSSLSRELARALMPGEEPAARLRRQRDERVAADVIRPGAHPTARGTLARGSTRPAGAWLPERAANAGAADADDRPSAGFRASVQARVALAPPPVLARQILEYPAARRPNRTMMAPPRPMPPPPEAAVRDSAENVLAQTRQEVQAVALREALQRFVGVAPIDSAPPGSLEGPMASDPVLAGGSWLPRRDQDAPPTASRLDLAERMADVLRIQAREHGIDLT